MAKVIAFLFENHKKIGKKIFFTFLLSFFYRIKEKNMVFLKYNIFIIKK